MATSAVGAALLVGASPASAVVNQPNVLPHDVTNFPQRDMVVADGYTPGEQIKFEVRRNNIVVGSSVLKATDNTGFLEVNHDAAFCWDRYTPNVLPGDEVRVVNANGDGDSLVTQHTEASAVEQVGDTLVMKGTAHDGTGTLPAQFTKLPIDRMESRIIQPDLVPLIGKRDLRATAGAGSDVGDPPVPGARGVLRYDDPLDPTNVNWTATWTGLSQEVMTSALAGESRILAWMDTDAGGERLGMTIYEVMDPANGAAPGCPAAAEYAISDGNKKVDGKNVINLGNVDTPLNLSLTAIDATAVSVSLDDTDPATGPVQVAATQVGETTAAGAQSWTADFTVDQVKGLKDGTLTARGSYTRTEGTVTGSNLTIKKDTVAPAAPTATPNAGTYTTGQSVALEHSDSDGNAAKVRYTQNGTEPTLTTGTVYSSQINVTATQTIRARTVDAAQNMSPVADFRYVIDTTPADTTPPPAPSVSPESGTFTSAQSVTMSNTEQGAQIRYTVGQGTTVPADPTATTGTVYAGPVSVSASQVIKAAAFDAAGNRSTIVTRNYTITTTTSPTPTTRTVTLTPVADTMARQQAATTTSGSLTSLKSDARETDTNASTRATSFLRFTVPALAAGETITGATLSLNVTNNTPNGPAIYRTATTWSESAMTWNAGQPARLSTTAVGNFGSMGTGRLSTAISGITAAGDVSLELFAESTDGMDFSSREHTTTGNRPQLIVTIRSS